MLEYSNWGRTLREVNSFKNFDTLSETLTQKIGNFDFEINFEYYGVLIYWGKGNFGKWAFT